MALLNLSMKQENFGKLRIYQNTYFIGKEIIHTPQV